MPTPRTASRPFYRLVHSSGELLLDDLTAALDRLAALPGARLFVLPAAERSGGLPLSPRPAA